MSDEPRLNRTITLADGYTSEVVGTMGEIAHELVEEREQRVLAESTLAKVKQHAATWDHAEPPPHFWEDLMAILKDGE